jgi:diacylglycerol kinase family enzyme
LYGKIISGNMPLDSVDVEIISDKATVSTNVPVSFQIDGEYCGSETNLNIEILPKQLKVAISNTNMVFKWIAFLPWRFRL